MAARASLTARPDYILFLTAIFIKADPTVSLSDLRNAQQAERKAERSYWILK
jgi:hypothetical protein